jgi:hypothetical protein
MSSNPRDGTTLDDFLIEEIKELSAELEAWKICASNLVDYAHGFLADTQQWGKGYERYDRQIQMAKEHIAEYNRLNNEKD